MWNGYDATLVDADGAKKKKVRDQMSGRGVLLYVARDLGVDYSENGTAITNDDLDNCARNQGVEIRRGGFVVVRTGHTNGRNYRPL